VLKVPPLDPSRVEPTRESSPSYRQIVSTDATEVKIRLELEEHTKGISSALATIECQLVDMAVVDAQLARQTQ